MAGMKLKNGADLCGFELRRFVIQNDGSDPTDVKVGRKYLNNGGGSANLRERIYVGDRSITSDGWRDAAYMDDINRVDGEIDEVSLALSALQEKVDAFLEGEVDSDAVLENLNEIKAYLDTYNGEITLSEALSDIEQQIAEVAGRATNVSFEQTLISGKEVGAITIDGASTKVYAPASYAWTEITGKPTTLAGFGIDTEVRDLLSLKANVAQTMRFFTSAWGADWAKTKTFYPSVLSGFNSQVTDGINGDYGLINVPTWSANAESSYYAYQIFGTPNGANILWRNVTASTNGAWHKILDDNNYASVLDSVYAPYNAAGYLPKSGGALTGGLYMQDAFIFLDSSNLGSARISNSYKGVEVNAIALVPDGFYIKSQSTPVYVNHEGVNSNMLHEGNYESIVGNKFLKLSGGTITAQFGEALTIAHDGNGSQVINFANATSGNLGSIGVSSNYAPIFIDTSYVIHKILHAGNYGSVLDNAYFGVFRGGTYNANTISVGGIYRVEAQYEGGESWPILPSYGNAIHVKVPFSDTAFQIAAPQYSSQRLFFRSFANSTQATQTWKEFAFTDSDITGNAASATKLQTARTIWGQSFDGSTDVSGPLYLHKEGNFYSMLQGSESGIAIQSWEQGKGYLPILLAPNGGNVGIGTTNPAYKLDVNGTFGVSGVSTLSSRVLIGGATDDGATALQVNGGGSFTDAIYAHKQINTFVGFIIKSNGTYNKASLSHSSNTLYIQSGYSDGSSVAGRIMLSGVNTADLDYLDVRAAGSTFNGSLVANGLITAMGGLQVANTAYLKIGDATLTWDSRNNALKVDKALYSTEEVSAGGVGSGSGGSTSGGSSTMGFDIPIGTQSITLAHNLGTKDIIVQVYEISDSYQQILTDVVIDNISEVTIMFGESTEVQHRVVIMG